MELRADMTRKWFGYGIICFYALMIFAILDIGPVVWSLYVEDLGNFLLLYRPFLEVFLHVHRMSTDCLGRDRNFVH
jgi:hypothetical protein